MPKDLLHGILVLSGLCTQGKGVRFIYRIDLVLYIAKAT